MNKIDKPVSTLWGCELSSKNEAETFKADDSNHQHQLALRTMCLGAGAKEEFNIIEVITGEPENGKGVPMATLHAKGMPTVNLSGVDLQPPVTFRLKVGTGPVYICAEHVALEEDFSDSDDDMAEEELEEEEEIESSPEKPVKKPAAKNGVTAGKRKKNEDADGSASDSENNPPKKGKGRGRKKV